jgi:hypothetical protein
VLVARLGLHEGRPTFEIAGDLLDRTGDAQVDRDPAQRRGDRPAGAP